MFETSTILIAFGLTLFAGLATGIGSLLACCTHHTNTKFLSIALGFSAGVMIYISFIDMFPIAQDSLTESYGPTLGPIFTVIAFFVGMLFTALIDKILPKIENPHEMHHIEEMDDKKEAARQRKLLHMGIFTAVAIAMHNFPEGIATFTAAVQDLTIGIPIAIAIAIHNIPEGIAISIPIFYATRSRKKAFRYSFLSGIAEPIGAVVGYFILLAMVGSMFGLVFAAVAGIMVFLSLDQLLPTAREYGEHHLSIYGMFGGMLVMAISLLLFL